MEVLLPGSGGGGGGKGGAGGGGRGRVSSVGGAGASRSRSEGGAPSVNSVGPTLARASLPPMDSRPRALGSRWHRRWKASSFSLMSLRRVCTWLLVFSYVSCQADSNIEEEWAEGFTVSSPGSQNSCPTDSQEGHLSEDAQNRRNPGEEQQSWSVAEQTSKHASPGVLTGPFCLLVCSHCIDPSGLKEKDAPLKLPLVPC